MMARRSNASTEEIEAQRAIIYCGRRLPESCTKIIKRTEFDTLSQVSNVSREGSAAINRSFL